MTTTWRLWRALRNPPALHPIFQRTVLLPHKTLIRNASISWAGMIIRMVVGLTEYSPLLLLILMPLILLTIGVTYGVDCAVRVGNIIAREREKDTFNLLSMSPSGALGASWAMCTSSLYRNRDFSHLYDIVRGTVIVSSIGVISTALIALVINSDAFSRLPQPALPTIAHVSGILAVLAALYLEYIQSTILGSLIGMLVPTYTQNRLDTSVYTFGFFALFQVTTYLLTYIIGFIFLPSMFDRFPMERGYVDIALNGSRLAIFFLVREVMLTMLWRRLAGRLNAYPFELDLAMQAVP